MSGVITLKLTTLLIRTVSKPVANTIKAQSRQSPFFKKNFVKFGQLINRVDLKLRNNSNIKVRPLNDNKAIELGSNFLSELFIFSTAAGLIIYESVKPKKVEKVEEKIPVSTPPVSVPPMSVSPVDKDKMKEIETTVAKLSQQVTQLTNQNETILKELDKLKPVNNPKIDHGK